MYHCDHRVSSTTSSHFPDWSKLATLKIWTAAAGRILSSLSTDNSSIPTLANFNRLDKVNFELFGVIFVTFT